MNEEASAAGSSRGLKRTLTGHNGPDADEVIGELFPFFFFLSGNLIALHYNQRAKSRRMFWTNQSTQGTLKRTQTTRVSTRGRMSTMSKCSTRSHWAIPISTAISTITTTTMTTAG